MERLMFHAKIRNDKINNVSELIDNCNKLTVNYINNGDIMTLSLYRWQENLYLYYECVNDIIPPDILFSGLNGVLEDWPDESKKRKWVRMTDIFHFEIPQSAQQWERKLEVEKRVGKLGRIKPEMLSSYIYYHYRLQEGNRDFSNKYCIIGLHENCIFLYEEEPAEFTESCYEGKLDESTEVDEWQKFMLTHFYPWDNVKEEEKALRNIDVLISL